MKFTQKQKDDIKNVRQYIHKRQTEMEAEYALLVERLGIDNDDVLWDYCFNKFGSLKRIEKAAKRKVNQAPIFVASPRLSS